jgi:hypothetical protein
LNIDCLHYCSLYSSPRDAGIVNSLCQGLKPPPIKLTLYRPLETPADSTRDFPSLTDSTVEEIPEAMDAFFSFDVYAHSGLHSKIGEEEFVLD